MAVGRVSLAAGGEGGEGRTGSRGITGTVVNPALLSIDIKLSLSSCTYM